MDGMDSTQQSTGHRLSASVVLGVFVSLLIAVAVLCAVVSRNIPFSEDWLLVSPLTGNEPDLGAWAWRLHHDHRIPLPKLLMLSILKVSGGDFRWVVGSNVALIGSMCGLMLFVSRRIRGYLSVSDTFFPLLLLNVGQIENMLWAWQITFVMSAALIFIYLAAASWDHGLLGVRPAAAGGVALVLLPLTGATGLLFAAPAALWGVLLGVAAFRDRGSRKAGAILAGLSVATLLVIGAYFIGYQRSQLTNSVRPSLTTIIWGALECLNLSFGPGLKNLPLIGMVASAIVIAAGTLVCVRRLLSSRSLIDRQHVAGLLVCIVAGCLYAAALSAGRVEIVSGGYGGWPLRYALVLSPLLCAVYLAFGRFGMGSWRAKPQYVMLVAAVVLLPFNVMHGVAWTRSYNARIQGAWVDLQSRLPVPEMAVAASLKLAWPHEDLADLIPMLRRAGLGPFAQSSAPAQITTEPLPTIKAHDTRDVHFRLRYCMPQAESVSMVWGVEGWKQLPAGRLPQNTELLNNTMKTLLTHEGRCHNADLVIPDGIRLDFGFTIVARAGPGKKTVLLWDEDSTYTARAKPEKTIEITSPLGLTEMGTPAYVGGGDLIPVQIEYVSKEAALVHLDWGINGWNLLPQDRQPPGAAVVEGVYRLRMQREGDVFKETAWAPRGCTMNFGFLITRNRGLVERLLGKSTLKKLSRQPFLQKIFTAEARPAWVYDHNPKFRTQVTGSGAPMRIFATSSTVEESWENLPTLRMAVAGAGAMFTCCAVCFLLLGSRHGREK